MILADTGQTYPLIIIWQPLLLIAEKSYMNKQLILYVVYLNAVHQVYEGCPVGSVLKHCSWKKMASILQITFFNLTFLI